MPTSAFPLSDPSNPQPQPGDAAQSAQPQQQTVQNTPSTTAPAPQPQQSSTLSQPQTAQPSQNGSQTGAVSNAAPVHPSVQRASVIRQVATALAGGPRYSTSIDPATGATTRTPLPMSKGDIGLAIALEVLSGSMAGLAQLGPGATGRAAEAGFQQVQQQQQQAQQQQQEAAQQQYHNETQALVRKANAYETNSRTVLNTAQSERYGVESLKDAVEQNAQLLSDYQDADSVTDSHVSQDDLQAGIQSGKYNATAQIAIPDGFTSIGGRYEQTFSIVANPAAKVPLTAEQAKAFADAGVPGFAAFKTSDVPNGVMVPGYMVANANQRVQAINLMKSDFSSVSDALARSGDKGNQELAKSIPNIQDLLGDKNNGPVLNNALSKFQRYVSHSDQHGMDLYESLQQMAAPSKPDPRNPKNFIPNPDANSAQTIAGAFGDGDPQKGWEILRAYHDEVAPETITNETQATAVLADPNSSPKAKVQARNFLNLSTQHKATVAGAEAQEKKNAEGTGSGTLNVSALSPKEYQSIIDGIGTNTLDASQMLRYGKADQLKILADVKSKYPDFNATQYQANLGLAKWATSGKGGDQIQALNTLHAHADDFTQNMNQLGNLDAAFLNTPINKLKSMTGNANVTATVARMLAVRTEYMNALNNNHALTVEDKADATRLLNENQSPAQWRAVLDQIQHTAHLRGAETNARYRSTFGHDMPNYHAPQPHGSQTHTVPAGATPGRDASGNIIGYRTADGQVVRF